MKNKEILRNKLLKLKKIFTFFVLTLPIVINGCVRTYYYVPSIIDSDNRYSVTRNILTYSQDNVSIKIDGHVYFARLESFNSHFKIRVENNSTDTVLIRFEDIGAYYIGRDIQVEIYKNDKKLDTSDETVWRIYPTGKEIIDVLLTVPSENSHKFDRHHVMTVLIDEIKRIPSDITFKFKGDFRI